MSGRTLLVDAARPERWLDRIGEPGLRISAGADGCDTTAEAPHAAPPGVDGRGARVTGGALVELTPYWLTAEGLDPGAEHLELDIDGHGRCQVEVRFSGSTPHGLRFEMVSIDTAAQRTIHRLSRHLRTVDLITELCAGEGDRGWLEEPCPLHRLRTGNQDWATVLAGVLVDGRTPRAEARWQGRELRLTDRLEGVGAPPVPVLCTSGPVTVAAMATVDGDLVTFTGDGRLAERRRGRVTLTEPIDGHLGDEPVRILDVSGQGFGLHGPGASQASDEERLELRAHGRRWATTLRHREEDRAGVRILPERLTWRGATVPMAEGRPPVELVDDTPPSRVIPVGHGSERVSTRRTSVDGTGPPIGVVLTSGWGQTKESSGVVASILASALSVTRRPVEVVRFDYRNTRGDSWIDPTFAVAGREALGFQASNAVDDLTAVIDDIAGRLGPEAVIVVVGVSFSGPLALKVASEHPRVGGLVQMMAATDLQDLIRRSTGGIDVVAELDRGSPAGQLDVLGVLLDTQRAIGDAAAIRLATFVDSEDLVHRCDVPVLWILGREDRFVDPERVRLLCAPLASASIVELPGGHVPTSSAEVVECVWPMLRSISAWAGCSPDRLVVPDEDRVLELWQAELEEAPRLPMPHPEDYWRRYLLGDEGLLGYEVLALTDEYRQLMADQIRLAELTPGSQLVDLGSGLGNLLDHLPAFDPPLRALLCDLAFDALGAGVARRQHAHVDLGLARWDAAREPVPPDVGNADVVVASLLLSVLESPSDLLRSLAQRMRPEARLVVSSVLPDADLSVIVEEVLGDPTRAIAGLPMHVTEDELVEAVRGYVNSAADLMRRSELGEIRLYTQTELEGVVAAAGFTVVESCPSMGSPPRASVVLAAAPQPRRS